MKKSRREKEELKKEIHYNNLMTKKVGKLLKTYSFISVVFALLTFWGFSNMNDPFLKVSNNVRGVLKWIFLVIFLVTLVISVLSFISHRNSKKQLLELIKELDS
ncbi:MAG: hypothetical protein GX675_03910 [Erysipelotrichaceae bacterium]|nr:hypothetical protein [Erysipelotrichaceae bacterium]